MSNSTTDTLERVRESFSRGDYLTAYSLVENELLSSAADPELSFLGLLCLARSGATAQAQKLYEQVKHALPNREDVDAFAARLTKDRFLAAADPLERLALGQEARDRYLAIYQRTNGSFPAINAATLSLLINDSPTSRRIAEEVLAICHSAPSTDYWLSATEAEASLLLGREAAASSSLLHARQLAQRNLSYLGTTYRQLREVCAYLHINTSILAPIKPPCVIHYCGHLVHGIGTTPGVTASSAADLAAQAGDLLQRHDVGFAFGSLACGADILIAERVIAAGAELHVVLPFAPEHFVVQSVRPGGADWESRFWTILSQATQVRQIVTDPQEDPVPLYAAASQLAMGLAILRSQLLGTVPLQLAAWNGIERAARAGTAADVALWKSRGLPAEIIQIATANDGSGAISSNIAPSNWELCSLVCADVRNFSKIPESALPQFLADWSAQVSELCDRFRSEILFTNTWGDAVFVVLRSTSAAAQFASLLAATVDEELSCIPRMEAPLGVRVSLHFGPAYSQFDPVLGRNNFYGPHVNKVARLEPCTPPGSVYCTEEFAAALAIADPLRFRCEYAGEQELPKGFGWSRMYHLQAPS